MKEINFQTKAYTILLFLIGIFLAIYSLNEINLNFFLEALLFLSILAIIAELTGIELPYISTASASFSIYFSIILLFNKPALAVIAAALGGIFRLFIIKRHNSWFRLADFSIPLINTFLVGLVYTLIAKTSSNLFLYNNIFALFCAIILYYIIDHLLSSLILGLAFPELQKEWENHRSKINFLSLFQFAFAYLILVLYKIQPAYSFLILPAILTLNYNFKFSSKEKLLQDQDILEIQINKLKKNLDEQKDKNNKLTEDLKRKLDESSIFMEFNKLLGSNLSLPSVLTTIISMIKRLMFFQSCVIFLVEKEKLIPAKYSTPYRDILEMSNILKVEETIVNMAVKSKKPLFIPDVQTPPEERIFKDEKSIICIPLIIQNEIIGVIYLGNTQIESYTSEDMQMLLFLANPSAMAIKSAQLYDVQEKALDIQQKINTQLDLKVNQLSTFLELGKALGATLKLKDILNIILENAKKIVSYQSGIIFLLKEGENKEFIPQYIDGPYKEYFKDIHIKYNEGVLGWAALNRKPLFLEDTKNSVLKNIIEYERSIIVAPLIAENKIIGVLYLGEALPNTYNEEDLFLITTISYQAAMAIKNAELYEKIAMMAITDGLTGLYTHRYFQERLSEEIKWAERYQKPLSLIFVDIDHFKQYNDTLGHPAGDALLKEIAQILKIYTRESDLVCRYGGDEFALILMEINKDESVNIAERIREGFNTKFRDYKVVVTPSIGVANFPEDALEKTELMSRVDEAAYRSKKGGKNRVTAAIPRIRLAQSELIEEKDKDSKEKS
ncbi:MAG: diguanylate cyclase [Armatimonadetes bacterium]|nr:diguanylate cyclase [Armatimonadota bacterium]